MAKKNSSKQAIYEEIIRKFEQQKFITTTVRTMKLVDILKDIITGRYILCSEQRLQVWSLEQKSAYILSCMFDRSIINSNINNNIIIVRKNSGGQAVIVDGQQRTTSLLCYFSDSDVKVSEFDDYSIADLIKIMKLKGGDNKILNIREDDYNYKLRIQRGKIDEKYRCILNNTRAGDWHKELQMKMLQQDFNITEITTSDEDFEYIVKRVFIIVNSGFPLIVSEIRRSEYVFTKYYLSKYDLAEKTKKYIYLNDKHGTKLIDILIDFDMIISGKYQISNSGRDRFIEENKDNNELIEMSKERTLEIINTSCDIFCDSGCFCEFNMNKNKWDDTVKSAAILPWIIGMYELLYCDNHDKLAIIDITRCKDHIINKWKNINIITGRGNELNKYEINNWIDLKTDHSTNKDKLRGRIEIIKSLIKDSITP